MISKRKVSTAAAISYSVAVVAGIGLLWWTVARSRRRPKKQSTT